MTETNPQTTEWTGWPLADARQRHDDIQRREAKFLYVVEFSDGLIKVGQTQNVRVRVQQYVTAASLHGARVVRVFISNPHHNHNENERLLIAHCESFGTTKIANEYFRDLTFADVVSFVRSLPQTLTPVLELKRRAADLDAHISARRVTASLNDAQGRRRVFAAGMQHAAELFETTAARVRSQGGAVDLPTLLAGVMVAAECLGGSCLHGEGEDGHAYLWDEERLKSFDESVREIQHPYGFRSA